MNDEYFKKFVCVCLALIVIMLWIIMIITIDKFAKLQLYDIIDNLCRSSRETSLAYTKLEEAQFWAIKGISREKK